MTHPAPSAKPSTKRKPFIHVSSDAIRAKLRSLPNPNNGLSEWFQLWLMSKSEFRCKFEGLVVPEELLPIYSLLVELKNGGIWHVETGRFKVPALTEPEIAAFLESAPGIQFWNACSGFIVDALRLHECKDDFQSIVLLVVAKDDHVATTTIH